MRYLTLLLIGLSLAITGQDSHALGRQSGVKTIRGDYDNHINLRSLASIYNLNIQESDKSILLEGRNTEILIPNGGRQMTVDGTLVWLHAPLQFLKRKPTLIETDYRTVIQPLLNPDIFLQHRDVKTILLDPGHGGSDSGAKGPNVLEKDFVLDISRLLRETLAQDGFNVLMTREFDRFIPLPERSQQAKKLGADLMVSIHANSAGNPKARGIETYTVTARGYPSTTSAKPPLPDHDAPLYPGHEVAGASALLGFALQNNLIDQTGAPDRGLRHARFMVLKHTHCPAALVELGFLSNNEEAKQMKSEAYRQHIVKGLAQGIRDYARWTRKAQLSE